MLTSAGKPDLYILLSSDQACRFVVISKCWRDYFVKDKLDFFFHNDKLKKKKNTIAKSFFGGCVKIYIQDLKGICPLSCSVFVSDQSFLAWILKYSLHYFIYCLWLSPKNSRHNIVLYFVVWPQNLYAAMFHWLWDIFVLKFMM